LLTIQQQFAAAQRCGAHSSHVKADTGGVGLDGQALDDDQDYLRELRLAWTLANRPGASFRKPSSAAESITYGHTRRQRNHIGQWMRRSAL